MLDILLLVIAKDLIRMSIKRGVVKNSVAYPCNGMQDNHPKEI